MRVESFRRIWSVVTFLQLTLENEEGFVQPRGTKWDDFFITGITHEFIGMGLSHSR